ncbi:MAG: hypothetical protein JKX92_06220 [Porticoccaceae bacterium]|nr:hypothetical protein [Porticoccaceae bacterium]
MRQATQEDFVIPKFRGKNPDEYEVREDGECVRKDRWEMGVQRIRELVGINHHSDWEICDVVDAVEKITSEEI